MANGIHHFASQYFESDTLTTLQFGSVVSFFLIKGSSVAAPSVRTTTDWATTPSDLGVLWSAGASLAPTPMVAAAKPSSGATTKLTGSLWSAVTGTVPPDLPILGRGGSYEITFGMYNQPPSALSISTEGLLTNTLIQGNLLA